MSRILVATAGTEYDGDAVEEAVGLLGAGHRYLFLTVYQGVVATAASLEGMWAPAVVLDNGEWEDADQAAKATAGGRLRQIVHRLGVERGIAGRERGPGGAYLYDRGGGEG